jgi:hypothetical protein
MNARFRYWCSVLPIGAHFGRCSLYVKRKKDKKSDWAVPIESPQKLRATAVFFSFFFEG